jgi:hypothetical protein
VADFVCWFAVIFSAICTVVWASVAVLLVLVIGDKLLELVSDWLREREC